MYQVIARKYRPQTFEDVVNQEHVKRTLANAIDQNRIGHGYIFSGPRGTGKTTMARILAMALNAGDAPSSKFDPEDPVAKEIAAGSAMDVVEIDAASNRRIDDIRELRESVRYRPARDRFKVFIIDEAHQITNDAFNALLKTLEEPPEWVVFVLCTTEPQAIPATILSRCQSFQFRAVEIDLVIGHLKRICEQEGVEADDDALTTIALAGDGSIRDGLSTLDQAIAACGKKLEAKAVGDLLGAIPSEMTARILAALTEQDPPAMLEIADRIFSEGRNPQHFIGELTRQFRNLLVMKVSGTDTKLVAAGEGERRRAAEALEQFSREDLTRYVQLLLDLYRDLQHAPQPRFRTEIGLLKLVYAGQLRPIEEAISSLSGGAAPGTGSTPPPTKAPPRQAQARTSASSPAKRTPPPTSAPSPAPAPPPTPAPAAAPAPAPIPEPPAPSPEPPADPKAKAPEQAPPPKPAEKAEASEARERLIAALQEAGQDFIAEAIGHCSVEQEGANFLIRSTSEDRTTLELSWGEVEKAAAGLGGRAKLGKDLAQAEAVKPSASSASGSDEEVSPLETEAGKRAMADPDVQAFQNLFPGQVRDVRNLRDFPS